MAHADRAASGSPDVLSPADFERLARFVFQYSGIKMPPSKRTMLEGRLRRRLRATGIDTFHAYCAHVFDGPGAAQELMHLIDAVTTNKTDFFREPRHFDYLRQSVLPALVETRRAVKAWSAACSTGAEPYTLAMVLEEGLATTRGASYSILATDLSTEVLQVARRAVFPDAAIAPVPERLRAKYVMHPLDPTRGAVRISPDLRKRVGFARLNLMDEHYPVDEDFDLVFCRNVLIYFDKPTQAAVLRRLCAHLRPGGHLFLGHSESIAGIDLPLRTVANTVFRRVEQRL